MNAELDAALAGTGGSLAMADLGGGDHGGKKPAIRGPRVVQGGREYRKGLVVSVGDTDVFIEFGPKELGIVPRIQWSAEELPKLGDTVEVAVDKYEASESLYLCSRPGSVQKAEWELLEIGQVIEGRVTGVNKGGLDIEVAGHRAFLPASHASLDRIEDLSVLIGEKLTCEVAQLDRRGRGNIILSRRDLLKRERAKQSEKLKESLKEGDVAEGTVRKVMPFGAFVDLGGVDGLVHLTDLTHDRVGFGEAAVAKHVKEGDKVRVKILKIDWAANRLSLGIKQLLDDPFAKTAEEIKEGADITGKVTRLADFGAFVELSPGVEGLVHVSELAHRRVNHPADVLKQNQVVQVRVLKVDPAERRISLSVKALLPEPENKRKSREPTRTTEEILKDSPALRRLREKFGKQNFKGGLS